jgi:hypothetical protein
VGDSSAEKVREITGSDLALMIMIKIRREHGKHHPDNYMNIIGYGDAGCGLWKRQQHNSQPPLALLVLGPLEDYLELERTIVRRHKR